MVDDQYVRPGEAVIMRTDIQFLGGRNVPRQMEKFDNNLWRLEIELVSIGRLFALIRVNSSFAFGILV